MSYSSTLVVKCGGAVGVDLESISKDVAERLGNELRLVLAHGGSVQASSLGERLGHAPRFLTSPRGVRSRYTDGETLRILTMAMAGQINPWLVAQLNAGGVRALGLSGADGALLVARRKREVKAVEKGKVRVVRDNLTGKIERVNGELLLQLLAAGYVPVISPPALDAQGGLLNVDADRAAAAVAVAVGASRLVILSNIPGLLRDPSDPSSLIERLPRGGFEEGFAYAQGRMKLKLIAAREALEGGVEEVVLADGRGESPLSAALAGGGTRLHPEALPIRSVSARRPATQETQPGQPLSVA